MARTKKKANYGVLFWIASILLLCVLYVANHKNIQQVLDSTRFMEVVFEDDQSLPTNGKETVPTETEMNQEVVPDTAPEDVIIVAAPEEEEPEQEAPVEEATSTTMVYFIRVSDDGRIIPEGVERTITAGDSPLTRTIESLLSGPNTDAVNRGLLNLVPEGTKLLSARIDNGVAYLNFSEEFRFNPMGTEGSLAQLQQIVYSATAFPSINRVQILVDDQILEYLNVEGIYIGAPLSREAFRA